MSLTSVTRNGPGSLLLASLLAAALAGCQVDLYTRQTEADANEMLGTLLDARISASKKSADGGKTWNVLVEESQLAEAVALLKAAGLPQQRYASLGDLFKKDGLISTPTEERVRFIHGVSQELGQSLAQIDGVLIARVHVVLPDNDPLAARAEPASASVFVKHRPSTDTATLVPTIKNFVVRGVQGLTHEKVSVTLVPAVEPGAAGTAKAQRPPAQEKTHPAWGMALSFLGLGLAASIAAAFAFRSPVTSAAPEGSAQAATGIPRPGSFAQSARHRLAALFRRRPA